MSSFHIFGTSVYGQAPFYQCTDSEEEVLALIKSESDHQTINNLRVVYGTLLEFEPARVVETFRIKETAP